ncbi:DUF456 family protein [Candidatus Woesearchaeota archaeon]|nr:DUF456 family protein [Candidatus Woesearchaeota archaeon]
MILETIALIIVSIIFLIGLVLVALYLPGGTFVIVGGALLYNLITWSWAVSKKIILVLFGIAVLAELIEFVFGVYGAKRHGLSNWTTLGFIVGLIIGAFIGLPVPIFGSVLGAFFGAFLGAFVFSLIEKGDVQKSLKAGLAAFVTGITSILIKLTLAVIMIVIFFIVILT